LRFAISEELKNFYGKKVSEFLTRLKVQASTCAFNDRLELLIVDKFVSGFKNGLIKDRFMKEMRVLYSQKTQRISITFNTNHPSSKGDSKIILMLKGIHVKYAERTIIHRKNAFTRIYSVIDWCKRGENTHGFS
jgi:hypothetical protein